MCDAETLIHLIEKRPAIYNFKMKEHKDKRIIDKLWLEIAEKMKIPVNECKTKWTCLRNSYSRFLRDQPPPGSAANKKKKTWYLATAMSFLSDHMMIRRNSGNSITPLGEKIDDTMSSIASPVNVPVDMGESIDYYNIPSSSNSKKRKLSAADKIADPMVAYFKAKIKKSESEDQNLTFFKSMLPDMKKLSDRNQRKVKQDFLLNLNKLLEEQEMDSSINELSNTLTVKNECTPENQIFDEQ